MGGNKMIWKVTKPLRPLFFCSLIALYFHLSSLNNEPPRTTLSLGEKFEKHFGSFENNNSPDMKVTATDIVNGQVFN